MSPTRYTDNTLAENPPGGKRHDVTIAIADTLPPEQGKRAQSRTTKKQPKSAAKPKAASKRRKAKAA